MIVAAEIGTKRRRKAFRSALDAVTHQTASWIPNRVAFWPSFSDPCLQAADYCLWAVFRYWEHGDDRSRQLIRPMIHSEYDLWRVGRGHQY